MFIHFWKRVSHSNGRLKKDLKLQLSVRQMKNMCSKVSKHCAYVRAQAREKKNKKLKWLIEKYGSKNTKMPDLPNNIKDFKKCNIFNPEYNMVKEEIDGVEIVLREGEVISLSACEKKVLARGPGYCVLKSVKEEGFCCSLEEAIVKHKWETMDDDQESEDPWLEVVSEEELKEKVRLDALAEEISAESRTPYDATNKKFNLNRQCVTNFKKIRVLFSPRLSPGKMKENWMSSEWSCWKSTEIG